MTEQQPTPNTAPATGAARWRAIGHGATDPKSRKGTEPMSAAGPAARTITALDQAVCLLAWASQASAAAVYAVIMARPEAWHSTLATDPTGAVCGGLTLVCLAVLWAVSLYGEQSRFYDRSSRRTHRKLGLISHAGVLVFAVSVIADQHHWVELWAVLATCTVPAVIVWVAWMRSLALPPEDQAVVDALVSRKASEAAARLDASNVERRRKRLDAIVTGLGYQLAEVEPQAEPVQTPERPVAATGTWRIPPRKHQPLVYLLRNGNRIKIGTTTELKRRIRTLSLRPENVALLLDGGQQLERELHRRFAGLRIGNTEWFAYDGPLIDFVHAENNRAVQKGEPK